MCGIIGVVSRPSTRAVPSSKDLLAGLDAAVASGNSGDVGSAASAVASVDELLRGDAGLAALMDNRQLALDLASRLDTLDAIALSAEAAMPPNACRIVASKPCSVARLTALTSAT